MARELNNWAQSNPRPGPNSASPKSTCPSLQNLEKKTCPSLHHDHLRRRAPSATLNHRSAGSLPNYCHQSIRPRATRGSTDARGGRRSIGRHDQKEVKDGREEDVGAAHTADLPRGCGKIGHSCAAPGSGEGHAREAAAVAVPQHAAAARRGVPSVMFPIFSSASSALWGVPRVSTAVDPKVGASLAQRFL